MSLALWSSTAMVGAIAVAFGLYSLVPSEFPDRLAVISEEEARIDNVKPYDSVDKWAANGSQAGLHMLNPTRVAYFDEEIRSHFQPPFRLLDAGCGGGLVSNALAASQDYIVEGIDMSPQALQYARAHVPTAGAAHFQQGSLYELPFEDSSFDALIVSDVLEHLLDLPRALRELRRVLKPGGLLLFDTIHRTIVSYVVAIVGAENLIGIIQHGSHDWRLFIRPEELEKGLADAGFDGFQHKGFEPSLRALLELSLMKFGRSARMQGSWYLADPSSMMISYIGLARKTSL
eukprot:TRINITY_DN100210_c0_g1_i1.p1 TRINITY_DN100210_c0_g1~~TRINITY_DN100210_c0_g1_i1.p1  ORF type:complete len:289 (-),score=51.61 TRINITY_DN100210_c0_g1_i1:136-1002(-)